MVSSISSPENSGLRQRYLHGIGWNGSPQVFPSGLPRCRRAARQSKFVLAGDLPGVSRQPHHDFLRNHLNGAGNIHMALFNFLVRPAWWSAKKLIKLYVGHGCAPQKIEIVHVQPERTVRFEAQQPAPDGFGKRRPSVRRQPHELVFTGVNPKTAVIGEGGINRPSECGKRNSLSIVISLPRPQPMVVVAHSPTPAMERMVASSMGDG